MIHGNLKIVTSATPHRDAVSGSRALRRSRSLRAAAFRVVVLPSLSLAAIACVGAPHEKTSEVEQSATAPTLGTTKSFAVLAGSTVTNTLATLVTGDLGVSPGSAVTGFPPGVVVGGTIEAATAAAAQAQIDATTAYNALAGEACDQTLTGQDLGGLTLTPGTYCFTSSAQLTGTLTLDAEGDPAAAFVFQIGSTLTTASAASVSMINGGNPCNVYWQVGSSAVLGTGTRFSGTIIALASITLTTGVSVIGRTLARTGAVTMDTNTVSAASCQDAPDAGADAGDGGGSGGGADSGGGGNDGGGASGDDAGGGGGGGADAGGGGGGGADAGGGGGDAGGGGGAGDDSGGAGGGSGDDAAGGAGGDDAGAGGGGTGEDAGGGGQGEQDAGLDAGQGQTFCGEVCTDLKTDVMNCGACGHACGASESCVDGVCCSP